MINKITHFIVLDADFMLVLKGFCYVLIQVAYVSCFVVCGPLIMPRLQLFVRLQLSPLVTPMGSQSEVCVCLIAFI